MGDATDLIELERAAWQALATSGDAAADLSARVLADDVLMLLPGGLVIDDRAAVVDSMRGEPWTSFELTDERIVRPPTPAPSWPTERPPAAATPTTRRCSRAPMWRATAGGAWRCTSRPPSAEAHRASGRAEARAAGRRASCSP
jgi:hypothetical protein